MIVPMARAYIVARKSDQDRLIERLGQMGVLHVEPVEPRGAAPREEALREMAELNRALQILDLITPRKGPVSDQVPGDTVREVLRLEAGLREKYSRLKELYRQAQRLAIWGDMRLEELTRLRQSGIAVQFFAVKGSRMGEVEAECAEAVASLPDGRRLVAVIDRKGAFTLPEGAEPVPAPPRDRASILAEASGLDEQIRRDSERLSLLASRTAILQAEREALAVRMEYDMTRRSGLITEDLFGVQGWMPLDAAKGLAGRIEKARIPAAVRVFESREGDMPPTLIHYSPWTRPIKALFDLLGTLPGYREMDLSPFFVIALPLFAAMLIGDAGYGFCIALTGLLFSGSIARAAGREKVQLLVIFGLATLVWGVLTANYFGITPETLARAGGFVQGSHAGAPVDYQALWSGAGFHARTAQVMRRAAPLWRPDPEVQRFLIIKVSIILGCLHLVIARFRRLLALFPDHRAFAEVGWIAALVDMLVLIWYLLFIGAGQVPAMIWWILSGALLFPVWFTSPGKGIGRRVFFGFASSLLPLVSTFSDTMSYLRLFAVGMASYYIAMAFNILGARVADTATWFAAAPVLVFGHGLNIGLAGIAIFAHGVRLNMLEFSSNAGVQWGGYAYRPYALPEIPFSAGQKPNFGGEKR